MEKQPNSEPPLVSQEPRYPDEYDLKIDQQVEKFVETKQKLTYFLITAAVAVTAFLCTFIMDHYKELVDFPWTLITFLAIAAASTVGSSLLTLYYENQLYQQHLQNRYERNVQVPQDRSMLINKKQRLAAGLMKWAMGSLFLEIIFAMLLFALLFLRLGL